jgi:hypothetical protein
MLIKLGRFRQKLRGREVFSVTGGGGFFYIDLMWAKRKLEGLKSHNP